MIIKLISIYCFIDTIKWVSLCNLSPCILIDNPIIIWKLHPPYIHLIFCWHFYLNNINFIGICSGMRHFLIILNLSIIIFLMFHYSYIIMSRIDWLAYLKMLNKILLYGKNDTFIKNDILFYFIKSRMTVAFKIKILFFAAYNMKCLAKEVKWILNFS